MFIKELQPEMAGIGPFIPHKDTPFAEEPAGTVETDPAASCNHPPDPSACTPSFYHCAGNH